MTDHKIMDRIIEKLHESVPVPISICDVSGRVIASTEPVNIGMLNLLALEALNINSKATASPGSHVQCAGASLPLHFRQKRIGAMVIEETASSETHMAELLAKTIELLYEEYVQSQDNKNRSQERDQFLYEWLHLQSEYTDGFKKQGEQLGIDITRNRTVLLMEHNPDHYPFIMSMVQKMLDEDDILFPLSRNQNLIILMENPAFEKKHRRIIAAISSCHTGVCSGKNHLHTAYQAAFQSLRLGKLLFPDEHIHNHEKMKLAIMLSQMDSIEIDDAFSLLVSKGKNAGLAETAITYIQLNGDIQKICEKLHIHRNSIPYRIHRIKEISGRNLTDSYDLLYLYASFIRYAGKADFNI